MRSAIKEHNELLDQQEAYREALFNILSANRLDIAKEVAAEVLNESLEEYLHLDEDLEECLYDEFDFEEDDFDSDYDPFDFEEDEGV